MIDGYQLYLVAAAAVATALVAGVFYAFSTVVMSGLDDLSREQGMAAMQSINITAVQPGLMVPFFGATIASVAVAVSAVVDWEPATSGWLLAGAGLYVVGTFMLTGLYHVPRNNRLAATATTSPNARSVWSRYLTEWTRMNHVRGAASLAAAVSFAVAIWLG